MLGSLLPNCAAGERPCGAWDFVPKYGKSLGMGSGAGDVPIYLADRLGGSVGPMSRQVAVAFDLAAVPNAATLVVSVKNPDGSVSSNSCSTSPCLVSVAAREGMTEISLAYESLTGSVLSTSTQKVVAAVF